MGDYNGIDGLKISINAKYTVEKNKSKVWKMIQPSNRLKVVFIFPEELAISATWFGISKEELEIQCKLNSYILKYDSWMLPFSGFFFQFSTKKTDVEHDTTDPLIIEPSTAEFKKDLKEDVQKSS